MKGHGTPNRPHKMTISFAMYSTLLLQIKKFLILRKTPKQDAQNVIDSCAVGLPHFRGAILGTSKFLFQLCLAYDSLMNLTVQYESIGQERQRTSSHGRSDRQNENEWDSGSLDYAFFRVSGPQYALILWWTIRKNEMFEFW